MINVYTQPEKGKIWLQKYQGCRPLFACILGFTETGLIQGISAAGKTPEDRRYTAIADAEFLIKGVQSSYTYPLPPLHEGISPVFITRSLLAACDIPIYLFNAGLPIPPVVSGIDLGGIPAQCLSSGQSLPLSIVKHLFEQGLYWGEQLSKNASNSYVILSECVVGGTTTALSILTGLGIDGRGKVNSSFPLCNHEKKWEIVQKGLINAQLLHNNPPDPFFLVAAVGDPMQIVVAGMAITASRCSGVLLAGGTQMLAVYALIQSIIQQYSLSANLDQMVVGTTRWVAEDPTGDTIGLARELETAILTSSALNLTNSRFNSLKMYEKGFVKEGVGAGGSAIAASLYRGWTSDQLLEIIESLLLES